MEGLLELDRIGKLIAGKYRLELVLGRGGMGTVYRATHTWTGRAVAVKYLHPDHAQDTASVSRFLREARAAASVRHPNAVDVLDMGQDTDGSAYLVLELLEGTTLADHLAQKKTLDPTTTARLLSPVLEALEELHRVGVVHRDFKPANIFLSVSPRGQVIPKLLDFGVAKVLDENAGTSTTTGIVVGTPAYMAPEQAAGNGEIGPWTDLWAVGAVMYQCLVGELPFIAPTPSLMLVDVMTKEAPRLASRRPDLSAEICAVVDRALTKDAKARFQSASEMAQALSLATGVELGVQGGALPSSALAASPSQQPPALPSSDTIQLSSDSMMVPTALPDAPTVFATPGSKPRSLPPPPLPSVAPPVPVNGASAFDAEPSKEEKKHWTGPNATGRLHAPRLARSRTALAIVALALLGVLAAWRMGASSKPHAEQAADDGSKLDATSVPSESSAPSATGAARVDAAAQKPALAEQPDASAGAHDGPAAATSVEPGERGAEPGRRAREGAVSAVRESSKGKTKAAKTNPKREPGALTSGAPIAQPPASAPTDAASPPRVVREW